MGERTFSLLLAEPAVDKVVRRLRLKVVQVTPSESDSPSRTQRLEPDRHLARVGAKFEFGHNMSVVDICFLGAMPEPQGNVTSSGKDSIAHAVVASTACLA